MTQLDKADVYGAIKEGVREAMWQMITNATDSPCGDFFAMIKEAAHLAFSDMADVVDIQLEMREATKEIQTMECSHIAGPARDKLDDNFRKWLRLSTRCENALKKNGVVTVRDIVSKTGDDLLEYKNFGFGCLGELRIELSHYDLSLRDGL